MTAAPEEGGAFAHPGLTAERRASARSPGLTPNGAHFRASPVRRRTIPSRIALLAVEITCQGELTPLMAKGRLETNSDNLPIRLERRAIGSAVQVAERRPHSPAVPKALVQRAAGIQAREQEIGIG